MTGTLSVLDSTGDTQLIWDTDNETEVSAARNMFTELKGKGYLAYSVDDHGKEAEVIREFDPEQGKIIMSPQLVGG